MSGKLIIIESGSDASGKATQTKKLYERLLKDGYNVRKVEYPNYDSESSALVKMYLRGEFGEKATDVDPYIASTFFSIANAIIPSISRYTSIGPLSSPIK